MEFPKKIRLPRLRASRRVVTDVIELAGIGCLVAAAYFWHPVAGLIALGIALIFIGAVTGE